MPEGMYLDGANTTQREALGLPLLAFNPDGEPVDIINHFVNFGWEYVYHCHILSHEEMDMMHAQVVGCCPQGPDLVIGGPSAGAGNRRQYPVTWTTTRRTRRPSSSSGELPGRPLPGPSEQPVQSSQLASRAVRQYWVGPGTGTRTYIDVIGNTNTLYEYQVYAINVVGDIWDYSRSGVQRDPARRRMADPDARLERWDAISIRSQRADQPDGQRRRSRTRRQHGHPELDGNATNETGFLIQRADDAGFNLNVVNATVGRCHHFHPVRGAQQDFYYRVLAFNVTHQSGWSNTASVTTP